MDDINNRVTPCGVSFVQQFLLHKGLKVFGEHGHEAATKEMDQLHRQNCFTLISVKDMMPTERRKAKGATMFLTEKRDKTGKGRMVYNGKPTKKLLEKMHFCSRYTSQIHTSEKFGQDPTYLELQE